MVINVGSGRGVSIKEVCRLAIETAGGKPQVIHNPRNDRGPDNMCADISLAKEKINYQPKISLEVGLRLTLEHDSRLQMRSDNKSK
jgi:nucleoside-diphosphate-sugar epimerase